MTEWFIGDRAYLVPNLPAAPRQAYQLPTVFIASLGRPGTLDYGKAEITLPTGDTLWVDLRNLQKKPWQHDQPRPHRPTKPSLVLADNEEQTTLW